MRSRRTITSFTAWIRTVTGGQIAPYVASALDTEILKRGLAGLFALIATALFMIAVGGL